MGGGGRCECVYVGKMGAMGRERDRERDFNVFYDFWFLRLRIQKIVKCM